MSRLPRFRELEHSTRFTFVRHGESEANKLNVIQGHSNSPLSETGREHARAAGRWLSNRKVDVFFSSPLSRSLETARIISRECGGPEPVLIDELKELNTGVYSGLSLEDSKKADPEGFRRFRLYSWDEVEGAESRESLQRRALVVWDRLIDEAIAGARHIVCVSHGGMLQWLIKATIAAPEHRWMPIFAMANCGISSLTATSTSVGHEGELPVGTGFYASWDHINQVPY